MPRTKQPQRREELEAALIDYLLTHGVADLSLRGVAAGLGISTYPLVYHFGSKDGMLAAALAAYEVQVRAMVAGWAAALPAGDPGAIVTRFWEWAAREETLPLFRLVFEIWGLALRRPDRFERFLASAWTPWIELLGRLLRDRGVPPAEADTLAGLILAVTTGAMLGYVTTGDRAAADRTIALVATHWLTRERSSAPGPMDAPA